MRDELEKQVGGEYREEGATGHWRVAAAACSKHPLAQQTY
jgi:hypothetical protein